MLSNVTIQRLYTENPFVDSLLYFTKILAYGSVIKMQDIANANETKQSANDGDVYILIEEGRETFDIFDYTKEELLAAGVPASSVKKYLKDKHEIPEVYRPALCAIGKKAFLDRFEEKNNYYRMITGLPDYEDYGIPIKNYEYLIPAGETWSGSYVHELGYQGCRMLEKYGILDIIKDDYPDAKYLEYVTCGITLYKARKAIDFQLLYRPSLNLPEIEDLYDEKFNENRTYMIHTQHSEAMKLRSDYYENVMGLMILLMTMCDMMEEVQDRLVKKDILDMRCIKYIFEMYGIPYYNEIPILYQQRIAKTIHSIVKDKSCARCMKAFIDLFGCDDIVLYKYYILRDRLQGALDGDYQFNEITVTESTNNDCLVMEDFDTTLTEDMLIPFPFENYLAKGCLMFVFVNNKLLEPTEYTISNDNKLNIPGHAPGSSVKFKFVYDTNLANKEFLPDTDNSIYMDLQTYDNVDSNVFKYREPPYPGYLKENRQILLLVDGFILAPEMYTVDEKYVTIDPSFDISKKDPVQVVMVYIYSYKFVSYFQRVNINATIANQKTFSVPEPFPNYCANGNKFFLTIGDTFIEEGRYTINPGGTVHLNDTDLSPGRSLGFNFLYSQTSIVEPLYIKHRIEPLVPTYRNQYIFPITFPISKYLEKGYRIYIKFNGWFLSEEYFSVFSDKIQFTTTSLMIEPTDNIELHFVYGPTGDNTRVLHDYRVATTHMQSIFDITYPVPNYFTEGNLLFVDSQGYPLVEGTDYHLSADKSRIILDNPDIRPFLTQRLNYTFIYTGQSEDFINIKSQKIYATSNGQKKFTLAFPFYPYLETGHNFLLIHKTRVIPPSEFTINKYDLTLKYKETVKAGDELLVVYIFNNKYKINPRNIITRKDISFIPSIGTTLNPTYEQALTLPFNDFITNGWPLMILDQDDNLLTEDKYEIVGETLYANPAQDILNYSKLKIVYFYKDYEPYLRTHLVEDFDKDIDLQFVRIPLFDDHPLENLKDRSKFRKYDIVTLSDYFWDGNERQDYHDVLKSVIKSRQFNYSRTKYMSVNYLSDASEAMFQLAYFRGGMFDKWKLEEKLTIALPHISPITLFKINDVFIFLTILSHIFTGYTDKLCDTASKVLYIRFMKGFNLDADIPKLKKWLEEKYYIWWNEDIDINDVLSNFRQDKVDYTDMSDYIADYKENKRIYKLIKHSMAEARDWDEYVIWKRFYDSLMIFEANFEYFRLSDGTLAPTYSDFLKERDPLLYTYAQNLAAIPDKDSRQNEIVNCINDTLFLLEKYIPSNEFKSVYWELPGISGDYLVQYLYLMINFFKSYKVEWIPGGEGSTEINFDGEDEYLIRPIDNIDAMEVTIDMDNYIRIKEDFDYDMEDSLDDRVEIRESFWLDVIFLPVHPSIKDIIFDVDSVKEICPALIIDFDYEVPKWPIGYDIIFDVQPKWKMKETDIEFEYEVPKWPIDGGGFRDIIFDYTPKFPVSNEVEFDVTSLQEYTFTGSQLVLTLYDGVEKEYKESITITGPTELPIKYYNVNGDLVKFTTTGFFITDSDQSAMVTQIGFGSNIQYKVVITRTWRPNKVNITAAMPDPWNRYRPGAGFADWSTITDNVNWQTASDEPSVLYSGNFQADIAKIQTPRPDQNMPTMFGSYAVEYAAGSYTPIAYYSNVNIQVLGAIAALAKYSMDMGTLTAIDGTIIPGMPTRPLDGWTFPTANARITTSSSYNTRVSDGEKFMLEQFALDYFPASVVPSQSVAIQRCNENNRAYDTANGAIDFINYI